MAPGIKHLALIRGYNALPKGRPEDASLRGSCDFFFVDAGSLPDIVKWWWRLTGGQERCDGKGGVRRRKKTGEGEGRRRSKKRRMEKRKRTKQSGVVGKREEERQEKNIDTYYGRRLLSWICRLVRRHKRVVKMGLILHNQARFVLCSTR